MKYVAIIALALAFTGCAATADSVRPAPPLVWTGLGKTVTVYGPRVTPMTLVEDSRCPESTVCVWAGQVRVSARVVADSRAQDVTLTLGEPIGIAGGRLELAEVEPRMKNPGGIPPENYRFGLRFTVGAPGVASEYDQAATADFFVDPT